MSLFVSNRGKPDYYGESSAARSSYLCIAADSTWLQSVSVGSDLAVRSPQSTTDTVTSLEHGAIWATSDA